MSEKIKIPDLCSEDWNKMTPIENGRFCDTCKLTVVDFTKMSNDQIKNYLLNKGHVCGRFDCTQVDTSHESTLELLNKKAKKIKFKPLRWLALLLLLIPVFVYYIFNSKTVSPPEHTLMGAVASPIEKDSLKNKNIIEDTSINQELMGKVISPRINDSIKIKKNH